MTKVLVVHHDIDLADQEVESLRRFGYAVEQCSGPTANTCPVLNGGTCAMAARSDVMVYDAWASGDTDGSMELIADLRRVHPTVPIVLTFPGVGLSGIRRGADPRRGARWRASPPAPGCTRRSSGPSGTASGGRVAAPPPAGPRSAPAATPAMRSPPVRRPPGDPRVRHSHAMTGVVLVWPGVFLASGAPGAGTAPPARPWSRCCATAIRRGRSSTRPARSTPASGCGWRRATSSSRSPGSGIAMYGMYLATVGMEAWS